MVEAPKGYEPTVPPQFDGGSREDQEQLLKLYYDFRIANDHLDNEALKKVWSADPRTVFFNTNGHSYYGLDDWLNIWDHYRTRLRLVKPGGSGSIRITVRGEMALVVDDYVGRFWTWVGSAKPDFLSDRPYVRATQVCMKEPAGWRVVHAHFSSGRAGKRPDQGGPE